MKIFTQEVSFQTKETFEFVRLTAIIQDVVNKSRLNKGLVLIKNPHATGALVVIENDSSLHQDTKMSLQRLLRLDWPWSHVMEGEINARAHQAALLLGSSVSISISNGQLSLGTWQDIFFVECLGARSRKVEVVIIGEK